MHIIVGEGTPRPTVGLNIKHILISLFNLYDVDLNFYCMHIVVGERTPRPTGFYDNELKK
jgi:hypothetical protein